MSPLFANHKMETAKDAGPWPILMHADDVILMKTAVDLTGKSEKTLRSWCKEYRIGRQSCPSAPIEFSAPALMMVAHGDIRALERLREGQRTHPQVKRYFDHLGIPA